MSEVVAGLLVLLQLLSPLPLLCAILARQNTVQEANSWSSRLLFVLVFGAFVLLAPALALGMVGAWNAPSLLLMHAVILGVGSGLLLRGPRPQWRAPVLGPTSRGLLATLSIGGLVAFVRLLRMPTDNFDSLAYHLPLMAHWVQEGMLTAFPGIGGPGWYPGHYELLGTLLYFAPRSDLWVQLPGLWSWALLGTAIYALGRDLCRAGRPAALTAAGLVLFLPDLFGRTEAIQPDTALAGLVLAGWWAALRSWRTGDPMALMILGASLALLSGLKYSGVLQAFLIFVTAGLTILLPRSTPKDSCWEWRRPRWLGFIGLCALVAGAWYLRNLLLVGDLFGELDREALGKGSLARVFRPGEAEDWAVFGRVLWEGLGPAGLVLALLGLAGLRPRGTGLAFGIFLLLQVVLYWYSPFGADNGSHGYRITPWMIAGLRYGYLVPAILALLALPSLQRFPGAVQISLVVATCLLSLHGLSGWSPPWIWAVCAVVLAAAILPFRWWALGVLLVPVAGQVASGHRESERTRVYGQIHTVLEATDAEFVEVAGRQELARYLGRHWSRRVRFREGPPTGRWLITAGEATPPGRGWEQRWAGQTLRSNEVLWERSIEETGNGHTDDYFREDQDGR